jgi:HEAT repeat protein
MRKSEEFMSKYFCHSAMKIFLPLLFVVSGFVKESTCQSNVDSLISAFGREKRDFKRSQLIERIGSVRNPLALRFLLAELNDSSVIVRIASTEALGYFGDSSAIGPLEIRWHSLILPDSTSLFFAEEVYEKGFIAASLAKLGMKEHTDFIFQALNSSDETIRYNMVYALGLSGGQDVINRLVAILITDKAEMVSEAAATELIRILKLDSDPKTAGIIKSHGSFLLEQYSP